MEITTTTDYLSDVTEEMVEVGGSAPPCVVVVRLPTAGSVISSLELLLKMLSVNQSPGFSDSVVKIR